MPSRRLAGVDAARGVALVGMMLVHVLPRAGPGGDVSLMHSIFSGRSAATFAVLAGVGLALLTRRALGSGARERIAVSVGIAVRGLLIGATGLAIGGLSAGVAVILAYYGVLFLLAIPLISLRAKTLAVLALALALVVPVVSHLVRDGDAVPFNGAGPTFRTLSQSPALLLQTLTLTGYYPALPWLVYLCAGLAAGRLRLHERAIAIRLLVGGVALALAASAASYLLLEYSGGRSAIRAATTAEQATALATRAGQFGTTPTDTWWWLAVDVPHASTPPDLLHTTGVALAALGGMLLLACAVPRLLSPLAAAGSMTLSLYVLHVLLLASELLPRDREVSVTVQIIGALLLAMLWRRRFARGPLEEVIARAGGAAAGLVRAR